MLYRKQRTSLPVWLSGLLVVVAVVLGFLAGRSSAPPATLATLLAPDERHLRQASGALDIVELEYARGLAGSAQSVAASRRAAQQAHSELGQVKVLPQVRPAEVRAAQDALTTVSRAVQSSQPLGTLASLIRQARDRLAALAITGSGNLTSARPE
ncbi:hypothetical protein HNQ07_004004 [Deinococcus metalli]|uniref:Uncharacterized protein n=1 Tax=Deinococcus metalli TaxID=1141878 RepID=A0A7W8KI28_9DEIO|nr:hypothetical protein [Deinococcus metalli]MBB5378497.1 hypothetical protein [Deinococcus metalli]GHF58140.1 hypothetical protein GCM10017781_37970 [Deinococcus metalli]